MGTDEAIGNVEPIESSISEMLSFEESNLDSGFEGAGSEAAGVTQPSSTAPAQPLSPAAAPTTAQPAPAPTPPAAPHSGVAPVAPVAPTPTGGPHSVAPSPSPMPAETAEQAALRIKAVEDSAIAEIAKNVVFTPQEMEDLQLGNFDKVLPTLVGKVHVGAFRAVYAAVSSQIPAIIRQEMASAKASSERESRFYKAFPQLDPGAHGEVVAKAAQLYFQANPTARAAMADPAREAVILRELGSMALVLAGQLAAPHSPQASVPAAPPAPRPQPFIPAQPGGGGAPVVPGAARSEVNYFSAFADELLDLRNRAE